MVINTMFLINKANMQYVSFRDAASGFLVKRYIIRLTPLQTSDLLYMQCRSIITQPIFLLSNNSLEAQKICACPIFCELKSKILYSSLCYRLQCNVISHRVMIRLDSIHNNIYTSSFLDENN